MRSFLLPGVVLLAALAIPPAAPPAGAGLPGGVAIVVGFHIQPAGDAEALPLPRSPGRLNSLAADPGVYDVWMFLHTRAPFIGAWSISLALDYDGADGRGVDVLGWEAFTDDFKPFPGWPGAGRGMSARWLRTRCQDPDRYLRRGENGWWVQPVCRLRVVVHGPDRIGPADPEPGVRPQVVECRDEEHDLDGSHSLARFIPAVFGPDSSGTASTAGIPMPVVGASWGLLKARGAVRP